MCSNSPTCLQLWISGHQPKRVWFLPSLQVQKSSWVESEAGSVPGVNLISHSWSLILLPESWPFLSLLFSLPRFAYLLVLTHPLWSGLLLILSWLVLTSLLIHIIASTESQIADHWLVFIPSKSCNQPHSFVVHDPGADSSHLPPTLRGNQVGKFRQRIRTKRKTPTTKIASKRNRKME